MWGGADQDVRAAHKERGHEPGHHLADEIEDALRETFVAGHVAPDLNYPEALHLLLLPQPVAVAVKDLAGGEVRHAGNHRDLVPRRRPFAGMFKSLRGGSVDLQREVVGKKEDVQRSIPGQGQFCVPVV